MGKVVLKGYCRHKERRIKKAMNMDKPGMSLERVIDDMVIIIAFFWCSCLSLSEFIY